MSSILTATLNGKGGFEKLAQKIARGKVLPLRRRVVFKSVCKPSSVVYGHLSTNTVTRIPQRYSLNRFGETPY